MRERNNLAKLPEGWLWIKLSELCTAIADVDHKMPKARDEGIPYISTKDFSENGEINFEKAKKISDEDFKNLCKKIYPEYGDILLSRYGTIGEVRLVKTHIPFQASYSIAIVKPALPGIGKFIASAIQSEVIQSQIEKYVRGVTQLDLGLAHIRELEIPVPPLAEQERILANLDELFTQLDAGVELLKKLKLKLKRYRQAVLTAAVEGKLTQAWREAHQSELKPASVLLERILKERREKWEADQLVQMEAKGKPPKDDSWKKKYKAPTAPAISDLPKLPKGWDWVNLFSLCTNIADVDHKMPKAQEIGIPYVSTKDFVDNDQINFLNAKKISEADYRSLCKKICPDNGDILLSRYGTVGEVRLIKTDLLFQVSYSIAIIKPVLYELSEFIAITLKSRLIQEQINKYVRGVTQLDLGLAHIKEIASPLPSLQEQEFILGEIKRIFSVIDQLEITIENGLKRASRLRQSILKQAFEGKLVPQDLTDEPAEQLLERIKAEKAKRETKQKILRKPENNDRKKKQPNDGHIEVKLIQPEN